MKIYVLLKFDVTESIYGTRTNSNCRVVTVSNYYKNILDYLKKQTNGYFVCQTWYSNGIFIEYEEHFV